MFLNGRQGRKGVPLQTEVGNLDLRMCLNIVSDLPISANCLQRTPHPCAHVLTTTIYILYVKG